MMHELTKLIRGDMRPALGVTEPGAIALAVSSAAEKIGGGEDLAVVCYSCGVSDGNGPRSKSK